MTNFPVDNSEKELEETTHMTRLEFVASLRSGVLGMLFFVPESRRFLWLSVLFFQEIKGRALESLGFSNFNHYIKWLLLYVKHSCILFFLHEFLNSHICLNLFSGEEKKAICHYCSSLIIQSIYNGNFLLVHYQSMIRLCALK